MKVSHFDRFILFLLFIVGVMGFIILKDINFSSALLLLVVGAYALIVVVTSFRQ